MNPFALVLLNKMGLLKEKWSSSCCQLLHELFYSKKMSLNHIYNTYCHSSYKPFAIQSFGVRKSNGNFFKILLKLYNVNQSCSKSFSGETIFIAAHLINQFAYRVLGFKSPIEIFPKYFPNFTMSTNLILKGFYCVSFVHIHTHNKGKLVPRASKCNFVGYSFTQKGYKCYHPPIRQFYFSSDVSFIEHEGYFNHPYLQGGNNIDG